MADTGENRQISARANAKEAETIRASQKVISKERAAAEAGDAAFGSKRKSSLLRAKTGKKLAGL
jgi:hypothetical protein